MNQAHWMLVTTDRGGMVRVNVHEMNGTEMVRAGDVDIPLSDFTDDEQTVLLDAFGIVASHVGATPRAIAAVEPHEAPPSVPRAAAKRAKRRAR